MSESLTPQRDDLADILWLQWTYLGQMISVDGLDEKPLLRCYTSALQRNVRRPYQPCKSLSPIGLRARNVRTSDSVFLAFSVEKCR